MIADDPDREDVIVLGVREGVQDPSGLQGLRERVDSHMDRGAVRFVLDMSRVSFFDARMLAYLLQLAKRLRERGGDLVFCSPSRVFARAWRIAGLSDFLPVYASLADARRHLES